MESVKEALGFHHTDAGGLNVSDPMAAGSRIALVQLKY